LKQRALRLLKNNWLLKRLVSIFKRFQDLFLSEADFQLFVFSVLEEGHKVCQVGLNLLLDFKLTHLLDVALLVDRRPKLAQLVALVEVCDHRADVRRQK
jgi:hypothetical protein